MDALLETRGGSAVGPTVTLVPDRGVALRWGLLGALTVGLAAWLVQQEPGPGGVVLLVVAALATFGLLRQAAAPGACAVVVDARGARGWQPLGRVELHGRAWLRPPGVFGEPTLRVETGEGRPRLLLLPVGCDVGRLVALLDELAGTVPDRRPAAGA